jgi:hypothetical protein
MPLPRSVKVLSEPFHGHQKPSFYSLELFHNSVVLYQMLLVQSGEYEQS